MRPHTRAVPLERVARIASNIPRCLRCYATHVSLVPKPCWAGAAFHSSGSLFLWSSVFAREWQVARSHRKDWSGSEAAGHFLLISPVCDTETRRWSLRREDPWGHGLSWSESASLYSLLDCAYWSSAGPTTVIQLTMICSLPSAAPSWLQAAFLSCLAPSNCFVFTSAKRKTKKCPHRRTRRLPMCPHPVTTKKCSMESADLSLPIVLKAITRRECIRRPDLGKSPFNDISPFLRLTFDLIRLPYTNFITLIRGKTFQCWKWTNRGGDCKMMMFVSVLKEEVMF